MKISELAKQTQVSKETIHHYIRAGVLPQPRKLRKNVADYNESYVGRIRVIKELQDQCFLPLSVIKKILKHKKGSPDREWFLQLHTDYFRPVDQLIPTEIAGEEEFRKATGLGWRWLAKFEEWRIITPKIRDGHKIYSQDDLTIGKVIVDMDRIGLGPKDGFDPEALKYYRDLFWDIVLMAHRYYRRAGPGTLTPDEYRLRSEQAREIMSLFFYHLYRKLSCEVLEQSSSICQDTETHDE